MTVSRSTGRQSLQVGATVASAAGVLGTMGAAAGGYFARQVITPGREKPDNIQILSSTTDSITVNSTVETTVPGKYGIWLDGGAGHVRVGHIQQANPAKVTRELLAVDFGEIQPGPARWNQYYYAGNPSSSLGLHYEDEHIDSDVGPLPVWRIPAATAPTKTCAIMVHGLTATRQECLRAIPLFHRLGLDVVVPSYRNDLGAPADPSGRYHLGDAEWRDIHSVMTWAVARGAQDFILLGWSMGGATVLATAQRSDLASRIRALVLNGPVIDWQHVLDHNAQLRHIPLPINRFGQWLLRNPVGHRAMGLTEPLDLRRLDSLAGAENLRQHILIIHSDADDYVPNQPALALAEARPDLVTLVPWQVGRHTKEWNTDPQRWENAVSDFVAEHLGARPAPASA